MGLIAGIVLSAGVWAVGAYSGTASTVIEKAENVIIQGDAGSGMEGDLAGITTRDFIDTAEGYKVDGTVVIDGSGNFDGAVTGTTGTFSSTLDVSGTLNYYQDTTALTNTSEFSTTTITIAQSGTTFLISGSGTQLTLPASTTAVTGVFYRVQVTGALDTGSSTIASTEGDNIEGSLIVAGAVVDCDAADNVEIDFGKENLGDYVEFMWSGTKWLVQDSGFLTSASAVCQG